MRRSLVAVLMWLLVSQAAFAEDSPFSGHAKSVYNGVKKILVAAAEKMPEENYAFKPVDTVRSFGQIVGHVAESQYYFCSAALGQKSPGPKIENTKTSKADLIAALKESFAYCDKAYDAMNDMTGKELVPFMSGDTPKLGVLTTNQIHTIEHYGNLVTYMRIKNFVPPTSDPEFMKQLMK